MDNQNTNKNVTEFEKRAQEKARSREKRIVTASAVFVLTALTLTGLYINYSVEKKAPIQENTELNDKSGGVMQTPDLEGIGLQGVDSGKVSNPDRTGRLTNEQTDITPASESSNTLVQNGTTGKVTQKNTGNAIKEDTDLLAEGELLELAEEMSFSFDGVHMTWPLAEGGEVLIPYSMDKAVYFETLDQYKYSPAMVISAEIGTPVRAAAAGKINRKYWDYETGWTYEMDLGGGFKAYYGQLDSLLKEENTYVAEGDILGYVTGPTKYFAKEGSNLYFAMTQNDRPVSPENYVGE